MVCFVPLVCLSIRKSCQGPDCLELGNIQNWLEHCNQDWAELIEACRSVSKPSSSLKKKKKKKKKGENGENREISMRVNCFA